MEIFKFEDMNIYHDTDWNEMQRKIYREVKEKDVQLTSKIELLNSNYEYMVYDSFIDESEIVSSNKLIFDEDRFVITDNPDYDSNFITSEYSLDISTDEVILGIDVSGDDSVIACSISIDGGSSWTSITPEEDTILSESSQTFQLKFEIPQNSSIDFNYYSLFLNKV